jgi:DNA-directed RNA polymerase subunit N (RpoN/RPB10)
MKIKIKKCKVCAEPFYQTYSTLQITCSVKCALVFNSEKEVKKRVKEMKIESQKLSDLEKVARTIFQKYIRERDKSEPCLSCGTKQTQQWDGSHLFSAEQYSGVIFHELNVNKCCCYCNRNLHGNLLEYKENFIKKYGENAYTTLKEEANKTRLYKYSRAELIDIANKYKAKLKEMLNN